MRAQQYPLAMGGQTTTAPDTTATRRSCWIYRTDGDLPGLFLEWCRDDLG